MRLKAAIALEAAAPGLATGRLVLVELAGDVDDDACVILEAALAAPGRADLIVDMSHVTLMSVAGAAVTARFADLCRAQGRSLRIAGCPPVILRSLRRVRGGAAELQCLPSVRAAFGEVGDATPSVAGSGREALHSSGAAGRDEGLSRELLSKPVIAMAQGMLWERYDLPEPADGLGLLRATAQQYNIRLHWLATAVTHTPRPRWDGPLWFPGRHRSASPVVSFIRGLDAATLSPAAFLDAMCEAACEAVATGRGGVHLIDPGTGALWLESQRGFGGEMWDRFGVVDGSGTACALAARSGHRVTVADIATDPVHDDDTRAVLLAAGSRSLLSTPVPGSHGRRNAVLTTHHPRPHHSWSPTELAALDEIAAQGGAWLTWYRRTRLLDALEHLHALGRVGERTAAGPCGHKV
ncbi:GAF domain-containing protein [Streptomyces sp. NPDC088847]|uniref:GAF domain-containing protein n=1 Tax=Streptomyces sp. NPDC088847 TaxID=3365909 RepID=UPI0037F7ED75